MADLAAYALITLEDAKSYIRELDPADNDPDDQLISLINAASETLIEQTGREFVALETNPATRTFTIPYRQPFDYTLEVGDLAALTVVSINDTPVLLADLAYKPENRRPWEPITALVFSDLYSPWWPGSTVEITGTWGFPTVPEAVKQACRFTVDSWYTRDFRRTSETFDDNVAIVGAATVTTPDVTRALPRHAYDLVAPFRRLQL